MSAAQLSLTPPGWCRLCSQIRLSVADTGGVCLYCAEERQREAAQVNRKLCAGPGRPVERLVCIRCGGGPVVYRSKCRACNNDDTRAYRARQRAGKAIRVAPSQRAG